MTMIPQPVYNTYEPLFPDEIRQLRAYVAEHRIGQGVFDVITGGSSAATKTQRPADIVRPYADVGATWWIEGDMGVDTVQKCLDRVRQSPPS
jgi:hypothetical protein